MKLIVFRVDDPDAFVATNPDKKFNKEQHGNGPEHYSITIADEFIIEIYPKKG